MIVPVESGISAAPAEDPKPDIVSDGTVCASDFATPIFSLVLGGPLFQLYRRTHLSGDRLQWLRRRVLVITAFAWLPLLLLSLVQRHGMGTLRIDFLHDISANVRFLIALPVLIIAEVVVHKRLEVRRFTERHIVRTEDVQTFNTAIASALRARNSVVVEGTLLALVYSVGLWIWRSHFALGEPTWYEVLDRKQWHLTLAGYWYVFVSIPIFQFILLRWYVRLVIWFRLLWRISRLNLRLSANHPDRAGGIGFLGECSYAFGPILFAQGVLLAGIIANQVEYEGRSLLSFKMEAAGFVAFFVLAVLVPLVMFSPQLERTKWTGSVNYGLLASRYDFDFARQWAQDGGLETGELRSAPELKPMVETSIIYSNVRMMHVVPFGWRSITRLAATTTVPLLPLLLMTSSPSDTVKVLLRFVF
jgi:hypothetical protein